MFLTRIKSRDGIESFDGCFVHERASKMWLTYTRNRFKVQKAFPLLRLRLPLVLFGKPLDLNPIYGRDPRAVCFPVGDTVAFFTKNLLGELFLREAELVPDRFDCRADINVFHGW